MTEQDGAPEQGATSELVADGDDELGDEELGDDSGDTLADDGDDASADDDDDVDAQPAMADSAATTTSAVPTRPVIGRP